jgi:hypothetical protein
MKPAYSVEAPARDFETADTRSVTQLVGVDVVSKVVIITVMELGIFSPLFTSTLSVDAAKRLCEDITRKIDHINEYVENLP